MLHASIVQCPVFGGKVERRRAAAREMRGVKKVVREEDFVAVVADNWWRANEALKKLKIEWDAGGNGRPTSETIMAMLRDGLDDTKLPQARKVGDAQAGLAAAAKVVEAEYWSPYLNHATMEPQTCTAWFKPDGSLEVWTSTQNGEASMAAAAEAAGVPLEKVEVHKMMLGGGFGRRGAPAGLRQAGRGDRQGDARRAGEADVVARGGHAARLLPPGEHRAHEGGPRCAGQGDRDAATIACPSILTVLMPEAHIKDGIDFTRGALVQRHALRRWRTSRSTTRCATATCRSASGARRGSRTPSTASASSTSWRTPRARTRSSSAWRC